MGADGLKISYDDSTQQTAPPGVNITFPCVVSGFGYNYFYHQVVWHKVSDVLVNYNCSLHSIE